MTLSMISITIGSLLAAGGLWTLLKPQQVIHVLKAFPRSRLPALILTAFDLLWVGAVLYHASFSPMTVGSVTINWGTLKPWLFVLVPVAYFLIIHWMDELLAPRALGGALLLIANPVLAVARWHPSPWRVIIPALVYLWIAAGILLVLEPWRFRTLLAPLLERPRLIRPLAVVRVLVGVGLIALGIGVY